MSDFFDVTVRQATPEDRPLAEELLRSNDLPLDGLDDHWEGFLVAGTEGEIMGLIGLERYGEVGLLRSLVVADEHRGRGYGTALVQFLLERCRREDMRRIYLLTTTAEDYFPRFGFREVPRDSVDPAVKVSAEFRGACPDTAVVMRLRL